MDKVRVKVTIGQDGGVKSAVLSLYLRLMKGLKNELN
jgi:hypothetical protein